MIATKRHVVLWLLLIPLALATSAAAQSFLGTIRGTVLDPQGGAVKGAAVLITDEATGVPRALETDDQGRYEAAESPAWDVQGRGDGPQLQEIRKDDRPRPRRRHGAGRRRARSRRRQRDDHRLGRSGQQHHARQPGNQPRPRRPAAARPAAQLARHPVVLAAEPERRRRHSTDIQFLGAKTYGVLLHPGRAGLDERDLRHRRQLGPGPRRGRGAAGPLELLQRRIRRPRRRSRHDQARRPAVSRDQRSSTTAATA